jgi:hypothetical protein
MMMMTQQLSRERVAASSLCCFFVLMRSSRRIVVHQLSWWAHAPIVPDTLQRQKMDQEIGVVAWPPS